MSIAIAAPALADELMPRPTTWDALQSHWSQSSQALAAGLADQTVTSDSCSVVEGRLRCSCVRRADTFFEAWTPGAIDRYGSSEAFAASIRLDDDRWVADGLIVRLDDTTVLWAGEATLYDDTVELRDLAWGTATLPDTCGAPDPVMEAVQARAATAVLEDGRWRITGYRRGPWPVPWARDTGKPAPGFLPPTVRAHSDAAEAQLDGVIWGPLTFSIAGGTDLRFGAGPGLVSERRGAIRKLDAMVFAGDSGVEPLLSGDVSVGERVHLRGRLEHPMSDRNWKLRRLARHGLFRDVRETLVGLSLSGPSHGLQIAGTVRTDPALPEPTWSGAIRYGTSSQIHRLAVWDVDLDHATADFADDTTHSTTATVGWSGTIGSRGAAWLSPGVGVAGNFGAVTARRGFDASTTLSVLPSLEAGLDFEGRWGRRTHRVRPFVRVGGEAAGLQQRQPEEGAPEFPYVGPDRWRWAVAALDQEFRDGRFSLSFPVGVFADAFAEETLSEGLTSPRPFARLRALLPAGGVTLAVACGASCESVAYHGAAQLRATRDLTAWYAVSNADAGAAAAMRSDELTRRPHTSLRLLNEPATPASFGHHGGVDFELAGFTAGTAVRWAGAADYGFDGSIGWTWDRLGWGIAGLAGYRPSDGDWAAQLGLSLAH